MHIESAVRQLGGVAHHSALAPYGFDLADANAATRRSRLVHVRRGWFAVGDAPEPTVRAVRVGGSLTCIPALKSWGVWCADDDLLHVSVGTHTGHLSAPDDRRAPLGSPIAHRVELHRWPVAPGVAPSATMPMEVALLQMVGCQPRDHAVAAMDSALRQRLTDRARLGSAARGLHQKHFDAIALADTSSHSGLETKARLRLRALHIPYRTQVRVPGVGHVDLVVGDRLAIELDGREWHSSETAFAEDRRRDLVLHERGYLVLRLTYAQTMFEWERVEALIRRYVATREHRWSAAHLRRGLGGPPEERNGRS